MLTLLQKNNWHIKSDRCVFFTACLFSFLLTLAIFIIIPLIHRPDNKKKIYNLREVNSTLFNRKLRKLPQENIKNEGKTIKAPELKKTTKKIHPLKIDVNLELDYSKENSLILPGLSSLTDIAKDAFIFDLNEVDTPPVPISQFPPLYPVGAKMRSVEGKVSLLFVVSEEGSVINIKVTDAEPEGIFNNSACAAVAKWKFKPAVKSGKNVPVNVSITLQFNLDE